LELKGSRVLVLGLGLSGRAAARKLLECGSRVTVNDREDREELRAEAEELSSRGARCVLGSHPLELLEGQELVVVSPGFPASHPMLEEAERRGIPIWSEIELARRFIRLPVVAVTGTNGKTTTVRMVQEVLREGGRRPVVAGNIGRPVVQAVEEQEAGDVLVLEVSSFQLACSPGFHPQVAVVLNVRDDHFDWHPDFADYLRCKGLIVRNQEPGDCVVCNLDDPGSMEAAREAVSRRIIFSTRPDPEAAVYVSGGRVVSRLSLRPEQALDLVEVMDAQELPLPGRHNLENALAATAVGLVLGVDPVSIRRALAGFRGLPHRIQPVGETGGVFWYDDSKATNPDAALRAVSSFERPLVPILGGRNKGLDFRELGEALAELGKRGGLRGVVLMGEAAEELETVLCRCCPDCTLRKVGGMEEAVAAARETALPGDVVLLTPACASFDLYGSYAERGDHFQELVRGLAGWREDAGPAAFREGQAPAGADNREGR
jgi:UDP-N-acetylmuramoylalanine--D-glutamate ligase